jgi:hypothetical protein
MYFKMFNSYIPLFLLLAMVVTSCDPAASVTIVNKSRTDKNIRVIYPANFRLPLDKMKRTNDSLQAYDLRTTANSISIRDHYRYPVSIPILSLDTANKTYSFNLKAGHEVFVEHSLPMTYPTFGQIFIIDNQDTVMLKRHGKIFRKSPKLLLGGIWSYTINDNEK